MLYGQLSRDAAPDQLEAADEPQVTEEEGQAQEQEKLKAVQFYLGKSGASLEAELDDFMAKLYKKYVPSQTREYIESGEEPAPRPRPRAERPDRSAGQMQRGEDET